jgi:hypothetical protein
MRGLLDPANGHLILLIITATSGHGLRASMVPCTSPPLLLVVVNGPGPIIRVSVSQLWQRALLILDLMVLCSGISAGGIYGIGTAPLRLHLVRRVRPAYRRATSL